jgi:hypothetical protein
MHELVPYDINRWSALLKKDDDLAKVAEKIRLLGENCVDELARSYLLLNDKKYLPDIVQKIISDVTGERFDVAAIAKERLHPVRMLASSVMERVADDQLKSLIRTLAPQRKTSKESFVISLISNSLMDVLILTLIFLVGCFLIAFGLWVS